MDTTIDHIIQRQDRHEEYREYVELCRRGIYRIGKILRYGRWCTVKSLVPEMVNDTFGRILLRKEYELLNELDHPGIPSTVDYSPLPGLGQTIVMEQIYELPLSEVSIANLPLKQRRQIANSLLDVMSYIHSRGIVIRSLRPDIIHVNAVTLQVTIVDFSQCNLVASNIAREVLIDEQFCAPEQFNQHYIPYPQCDVHALGRILDILNCGPAFNRHVRDCVETHPVYRPNDASELQQSIKRTSARRRHRAWYATGIAVAIVGTIIVSILRSHPVAGPAMSAPAFSVEEPIDDNHAVNLK